MLPTGVAGVVLGHVGGSSVSASLGLGINTTTGPVHTKVVVNGVEIAIDLDTTGFTFLIQDVDINLGGLFEIRGDFRLSAGAFSGSGLEIFIGSGPSLIDGALNPDAIGVLITNATISYQSFGATAAEGLYAIYVTGTVTLLGLPGLRRHRHRDVHGQHDRRRPPPDGRPGRHRRQHVLVHRQPQLRGRGRVRDRRHRRHHAPPGRRPRRDVLGRDGRDHARAARRCSASAATRPSRSAPAPASA